MYRISGKNFGKCELAEELAFRHDVPLEEVPHCKKRCFIVSYTIQSFCFMILKNKGVCIAKHESTFDTSAINRNYWDGSKDYGLFQINDRYWCSPPDDQNSCRVNCVDLLDDDIRNDVKCARKIFKIHRRNEGNGFLAW
ncbi:unnamed protein product [Notodromas monacha]|uniref:lysozyme n=1 Tax=Notodromas monacha TaxID=399045 RepID=A0A7R9BYK3_9CRUS|nr:unnamed protein product [Notodromas monacha]CAG0924122.1 unnamed protein product [Notodromas monacha]